MKTKKPVSKQPIPSHAKRVFKGKIFEVYQWRQKLFDGSYTIFEKIKRPDIVNVLPIVNGKIVLTVQKQPGIKLFIGAAGGRIDKDETPLQAAKRELLEETGYVAKKFILWYAVQLHSKIEFIIYNFIAKDCQKRTKLKLDRGEKIELKSFTFDEFSKITTQENFRDTEIALKVLRARNNPKELTKMRKLFVD